MMLVSETLTVTNNQADTWYDPNSTLCLCQCIFLGYSVQLVDNIPVFAQKSSFFTLYCVYKNGEDSSTSRLIWTRATLESSKLKVGDLNNVNSRPPIHTLTR